MFKITEGKGFHVTFANGYTVSVQFGYGNYSDNYHNRNDIEGRPVEPSTKAEFAAWNEKGEWLNEGGDEIQAWKTPDEMLAFMNKVASL